VTLKPTRGKKRTTDHPPIYPVDVPKGELHGDQARVYDLVVRRFLAAFLDAAVWKIVERTTRVNDDAFRTTAKVLATAGWREAFGKELTRIAPDFPKLVVLDADVAGGTGVHHFRKAYPEKFLQFGIAEQNMVAAESGLASRLQEAFPLEF